MVESSSALLLYKNSELKAKFLFKNKATKSSKNLVSFGGNVDWVVGDCIGGNFVLGENVVVGSLFLAMSQSEPFWLLVFLLGSVRVVML